MSKEKEPAQTRDDRPPYPKGPTNIFLLFSMEKKKEKYTTAEIKEMWDKLDNEDKKEYQEAY